MGMIVNCITTICGIIYFFFSFHKRIVLSVLTEIIVWPFGWNSAYLTVLLCPVIVLIKVPFDCYVLIFASADYETK